MKASSKPTLSFLLLFAFLINLPLLAFSDQVEPVLDTNGNPISTGGQYFIMPALRGPGGGLRLGLTGKAKCPVTVLQHNLQVNFGLPVKFTTVPGINTDIIGIGAPLRIAFTQGTSCASSSRWWMFGERDLTGKLYAGIGSSQDNPDISSGAANGNFTIKKSGCGYKLVFCQAHACWDLGRLDNNEGGRRLILAGNEPYEVSFVNFNNVATAAKFDGIGSSVRKTKSTRSVPKIKLTSGQEFELT